MLAVSFLSEEEIIDGKFIFVSYKHEDKAVVAPTADGLISMGVRLWYDADLAYGDNWQERVKRLICHPNCQGVLYFCSCASFMSPNVAVEREWGYGEFKKRSAAGEPYFYLPINIGKPSAIQLLKSCFAGLEDDGKILSRKFPLESIRLIAEMFTDKLMYCSADLPREELVVGIFNKIKTAAPETVDKGKVLLSQIKNGQGAAGDYSKITFGIRPGEAMAFAIEKGQNNTNLEKDGVRYIVQDGVPYKALPVVWLCLHANDREVTLLAEDAVAVRNGGGALRQWLNEVFRKTAFSGEEEACLSQDVRLLTNDDILKAKNTDFLRDLSAGGMDTKWWIGETGNMDAMQQVIRSDGSIYKAGYNVRKMTAAVRPVIQIPTEKFQKILENQ